MRGLAVITGLNCWVALAVEIVFWKIPREEVPRQEEWSRLEEAF